MNYIKNIIFLFLLLLISCSPKSENLNDNKELKKTIDNLENKQKLSSENELTKFFKIQKRTPITDSTNINSLLKNKIPEKILNKTNLLQIKKFETKDIYYNYSLNISNSFLTVILNLKENEQEVSTYLVNLNKNGKYLDYKLIAYDEIAEGLINIYSTINQNKITIIEQNFWNEEVEIKKLNFKINESGKIKNSY